MRFAARTSQPVRNENAEDVRDMQCLVCLMKLRAGHGLPARWSFDFLPLGPETNPRVRRKFEALCL